MKKKFKIAFFSILFIGIVLWGSVLLPIQKDENETEPVPIVEETEPSLNLSKEDASNFDAELTPTDQGLEDAEYFSAGAEDIVWNFFGYLQAGNYKNAATFFHPDYYLGYFYQDQDIEGKFQTFGETIVRSGIEEVSIEANPNKSYSNKHIIQASISYSDGQTKDIELYVVTEDQTHVDEQTAYIMMKIEDIYKQLE